MVEFTQAEKNAQRLGGFVQDAMGPLTEDFPDGEVGTMALVIEIRRGNATTTRFICSDPRNFVHIGLLRSALLSAEES